MFKRRAIGRQTESKGEGNTAETEDLRFHSHICLDFKRKYFIHHFSNEFNMICLLVAWRPEIKRQVSEEGH